MQRTLLASAMCAALGLAVQSASAADLRLAQQPVPGRYIVVLKEDSARLASEASIANRRHIPEVAQVAQQIAAQSPGRRMRVLQSFNEALRGFVANNLSDDDIVRLLEDPRVDYVEEDGVVRINTTQNNATWGLDRIDQASLPLNGTYVYDTTASNVHAYIIDTGIRASHNDFGGRVSGGYSAINDGNGTHDCQGHGTHVAGTVGSATYGVAKGVRLYPVRVLGCDGSGTNSGVIAGIDWVRTNHSAPAVANMSLGGGASSAVDSAVANLSSAGVTVVVAAGNDSSSACNYSPARAPSAITVGSTTSSDSRSSFSNYGSCLDIFAPGSSILSTSNGSNSATATLSGTSMASPHVAGAAALYLAGNPSASPSQVTNALINAAVSNAVGNPGSGSPNRLLQTGADGGTNPPDPDPDPDPPGDEPCTACAKYSGSLSYSGDYDYQPDGNYYYSSGGTQRGWLRGPSNADFDLELHRWSWWGWTKVAQGISSNSSEDVTYNGSSGYYMWRVVSYSGSGNYDFYLSIP
ncbi:S8 family peptidase [Pseudoxanthomonas sp. CAU 1598]|uniref:S8 family peptidase n=2 Tax=Pseudomarimonas arenosa TaxID=2774145 RepID=A0AAW3ZPE3_9GAMM|nr:S8 family peptidase [Pseudomarimonas arenosa]